MSRMALINITWGFFLIFVAACGGVFVALETTQAFVHGALTPRWEALLQTASHGHVSLFGVIHVLLGLTLSYTRASVFENKLKTLGVALGSLAMGPFLLIRGALGPTLSTEFNGVVIGVCLSCALFAIAYHALGLFLRLWGRA